MFLKLEADKEMTKEKKTHRLLKVKAKSKDIQWSVLRYSALIYIRQLEHPFLCLSLEEKHYIPSWLWRMPLSKCVSPDTLS